MEKVKVEMTNLEAAKRVSHYVHRRRPKLLYLPNETESGGIGETAVIVADVGDLRCEVELLEELGRHGYACRRPLQALLLVLDDTDAAIVGSADGLGSRH